MNIALVEDHPDLRQTFADILAATPGHRMVAAFASAEDARKALRPGMADLVVVDLEVPGESGTEFIAWLSASGLGIPAIVWTIHEGREAVYAALKAGATGYLIKAIEPRDIQSALDEIEQGGAPMSPRVARRLLADLVGDAPPPTPSEALSARERDVLLRVAQGLTHKEIGIALGISPGTVHTHLNRIYKKLHAFGRAEALARARQIGIVV